VAAEGDYGVGPADGPVVACLLESLPDDPLAVGFRDARADEQAAQTEPDDEAADKPGYPDVGEPRVSDLCLAQVTITELRAGEVRGREAGSAKRVSAVIVGCRRAIVPNRPRMCYWAAFLMPPDRESGLL
jgi:hypothetical protein